MPHSPSLLLMIDPRLMQYESSPCADATINSARQCHNGLLPISNFFASPTIAAREENWMTTY
jgi:hypothetical protein